MSTASKYYDEFKCCLNLPTDTVTLRKAFLSMLRLHFSDPGHYGVYRDELGCIFYDDDPLKSKLHIALSHTTDPKKVGPVPAIYVGLEAMRFAKQAINNYEAISDDMATSIFTQECQSSLKVSHIAEHADQALLLAENTLSVMAGMRPMLMEAFDFLMFDVGSLSEPKPYQKEPEGSYIVDVTVALAFNFRMSCNIESHPLARIRTVLTPVAGV